MTRNYPTGILFLLLFSSCMVEKQGYYLSPHNANSNPYHPIPLKSDSIPSAFYVNLAYYIGRANDLGSDQVSVFQGGIHRSHNFGIFQAYYGANLSLGTYNISGFDNQYYSLGGGSPGTAFPYDTTSFHILDKGKFFGGYGIAAGINIVASSRRVEWRVLGLETSFQNEFGKYTAFRKDLPDSAADMNFRNTFTGTLGLYTDYSFTDRHRIISGFKFAAGMMINPNSNYLHVQDIKSANIFPVTYFSTTFHIAKDQVSAFIQLNLGTYADGFQCGISYRLGKK